MNTNETKFTLTTNTTEYSKLEKLIVENLTVYPYDRVEDVFEEKYRDRKDLCFLIFNTSKIPTIPPGLGDFFSHLLYLEMTRARLKEISKSDLSGFKNLRALFLCENDLESLPGDLFEDHPNLVTISFAYNKLSFIGKEIFDPIKSEMRLIDMRGNVRINAFHTTDSNMKCNILESISKEEMKRKIAEDCQPNKLMEETMEETVGDDDVFESVDEKIPRIVIEEVQVEEADGGHNDTTYYEEMLETTPETVLDDVFEPQEENVSTQNDEPETDIQPEENNFLIRFKEIPCLDALKDFVIHLKGGELHLHRFILASYSPALSLMFEQNPEAKILELVDVSIDSFTALRDFIYDGKYPVDQEDILGIYAAAYKLEIEPIKKFTEEKLLKEIDEANAYDVLCITAKCPSPALTEKAFEIIKTMIPERNLKDSWKNQPEKIKKLLDAKKKMDDLMQKAKEEFETLNVSDKEDSKEESFEVVADSPSEYFDQTEIRSEDDICYQFDSQNGSFMLDDSF